MGKSREFHRRSIDDRDAFWREQPALVDGETPPTQICDCSHAPLAKWFAGGRTNLRHNAVARHVAVQGDQPALIGVSTETDQEIAYSFRQLQVEGMRRAAALLSLGVKQGARVLVYRPMTAEAAFAMLACTHSGAIHSAVFGGFASHSPGHPRR